MKPIIKFIYVIIVTVMIFAVLYTIVEALAFSERFYDREYKKLDRAYYLGMSHDDLMKTTGKLLAYMGGSSPDMVVYAVIDGEEREVFNEQEKVHMVDVAALFRGFSAFRWIAFGVFAVAVGLFFVLCRRGRLLVACRLVIAACAVAACILAALGIWAAADFNSFWTAFHELLFTNDLWLFDERTSVMINMFPAEFFFDFIMRFLAYTALAIGVPLTASLVINARARRAE